MELTVSEHNKSMEREGCEHSTSMEWAGYDHSMNVKRGVCKHNTGMEKHGTHLYEHRRITTLQVWISLKNTEWFLRLILLILWFQHYFRVFILRRFIGWWVNVKVTHMSIRNGFSVDTESKDRMGKPRVTINVNTKTNLKKKDERMWNNLLWHRKEKRGWSLCK
jgi:hypothetical protein